MTIYSTIAKNEGRLYESAVARESCCTDPVDKMIYRHEAMEHFTNALNATQIGKTIEDSKFN